MSAPLSILYWIAIVVAPALTFSWAVRRGLSRRDLLIAVTFAGGTVGIPFAVGLALDGLPASFVVQWILASAFIGLALGILGLVIRALGPWLSRAP